MPDGPVASFHYGKAAVRFYRAGGRHRLFCGEVMLDTYGERLRPAWVAGDNTQIVATDSMKNFIHAAVLEYGGDSLEEFVPVLGRRFLDTYPQIGRIEVRARELPFAAEGRLLYRRAEEDYGTVEITMDAGGVRGHRQGREGLRLVKITGSSFTGFLRDKYTTLADAVDRPLFIHLNVYWRNRAYDERVATPDVRAVVTETFDTFVSQSIQHLVHEMGRRILDRFPAVVETSFEAENRTWEPAFPPSDDGGRAVYTDPRPPYGVIGLTLTR
jgi:urate oxidase / 2-oxo-4-hydroxy-4-carboxy-5-ureidoimidazoline decarboxylase